MTWVFGRCRDGETWFAQMQNAEGGAIVTVAGFLTWQDASRYPQQWMIEHLANGRAQERLDEAHKAKLAGELQAELVRALAEMPVQGRVS